MSEQPMTSGAIPDSFIARQKRRREDFLDRHWEAHDWANYCFSGSTYALWDKAKGLTGEHANGLVLDAGAGRGAWKRTILETAGAYESIDIAQRGEQDSTWIGDIENMPQVPTERYDTIVCHQVLEHVRRPWLVLGEFSRVLKPGGCLILSVPHLSRRHELPHDYYRYTQEGLSFLVDESGLELRTVTTYGGVLSFLHHQTSFFFPGAFLGIPLMDKAALTLNAPLSWLASKLDGWIDRGGLMPLGVLLVAEKPRHAAD